MNGRNHPAQVALGVPEEVLAGMEQHTLRALSEEEIAIRFTKEGGGGGGGGAEAGLADDAPMQMVVLPPPTGGGGKRTAIPGETVAEIRALPLGKCFALLSDALLTHIPQLLCCTSLHTLDMSNNRLAALPQNLDGLSQLVCLELKNNKISRLPSTLRHHVSQRGFLQTSAVFIHPRCGWRSTRTYIATRNRTSNHTSRVVASFIQ
jgi:hypothetical protein